MPGTLEHLEDTQLERAVLELAVAIDERVSRWLPLVAEFDRRRCAQRRGFRSTAHWLMWRCHLSERTAREHVRVARRLGDMPRVGEAFRRGDLSYSKVRALTRASEYEDEEPLLRMALGASAAEVEQTVRSLRTSPSAGTDVANLSHARRSLHWWWEDDGSLRFCGRLAPDDGSAFVEAIETAAGALHPAGVEGAEPPPPAARRADALAEMAVSGCPRTHVVVHVDAEALACTSESARDRAGELCALEHGPAVPSETARRLSCDGELVVTSAGETASATYGRSRRVVPPPLRRRLERRDGGCRFPGCPQRHGLHAHHLTHWAHGGSTDEENLALVCRFHHRLLHEGGFTVRRLTGGGTLEFRDPQGRVVPGRPPPLPRQGAAAAGRPPEADGQAPGAGKEAAILAA